MFKVNTKNAGTWERIDENHALQIHSKSCQVARHQSGPSTGGQNHLFEHIGNPGDFHDQRTSLQGIKKKMWPGFMLHGSWSALVLEKNIHPMFPGSTPTGNGVSPPHDRCNFSSPFNISKIWYTPRMSSTKRDYFNRICIWKTIDFQGTAVSFRGTISMILIVISFLQPMKLMILLKEIPRLSQNLREASLELWTKPICWAWAFCFLSIELCWASIPSKFAKTDFSTQFPAGQTHVMILSYLIGIQLLESKAKKGLLGKGQSLLGKGQSQLAKVNTFWVLTSLVDVTVIWLDYSRPTDSPQQVYHRSG